MSAKLLFCALSLSLSIAFAGESRAAPVQLKYGRYSGFLAVGPRKLAATLDLFVVQPSDVKEFPVLNGILRISLGGPKSPEYMTQTLAGIRYDFTTGALTVGDASSDLVFTATVTPEAKIGGQVFVRSAGLGGELQLFYPDDDDPDQPGGTLPPTEDDEPTLRAAFSGACGGAAAVLQIETVRDLGEVKEGTLGTAPYLIGGRLGMRDEELCPAPRWCTERYYASGTYNPFLGRLTLNAPTGVDECQLTKDHATCRMQVRGFSTACEFTREKTTNTSADYYTRAHWLSPTPAELLPLPAPHPPESADLVKALAGEFIGWLHHEATNRYQVARLYVLASPSTDNPHNENNVVINANAILHFGRERSREFQVQPFLPRPFYLVPGFSLEGQGDAFLVVQDWRQGYVRAIWYSRSFGRIGTVEFVKRAELPALPAAAKIVPSVAGLYVGPERPGDDELGFWYFELAVPPPPAHDVESTLDFVGHYGTTDHLLPRDGITAGAYDFYTGALGWLTRDGRIISGEARDGESLALFWGSAPEWGVYLEQDHGLYPYKKHQNGVGGAP